MSVTPVVVDTSVAVPATRRLEEELARAVEEAASIDVLRALAAVNPGRASRWLRDNYSTFSNSSNRLNALLEDLVRTAVTGRDHEIALAVAEFIAARPEAGTPPVLSALATVLDLPTRTLLLGPLADQLAARNPDHADLVRLSAEHAIATANFTRAEWLITQLTRRAETPASVQQASRMRAELPEQPSRPVKVALLSSFIIDTLVPFLTAECQAARLAPELYIAPFNSWERELRHAESRTVGFAPDVAFLLLAVDDLIPQLASRVPPDQLEQHAEATVQRISDAVRASRNASTSPVVVHLLDTNYAEDFVAPGTVSRRRAMRSMSAALERELSSVPNVFMRGPEPLRDDPRLRHLARMRVVGKSLHEIAGAYVRLIGGLCGVTRKCIVLDLDNTLWGGVVGEDGVAGIRLSTATPGSEFVEFQQYLRSLLDRGFVLAVASKNNEADALDVFRNHDAMVLREEDFVALRINWRPKPENVRSIAEELGIGLDAMVFVDDNPDERELMRQTLPQVLTVEMPKDAAQYRAVLSALPELNVLRVTEEDKQRTQLYRARRQREAARSTAVSLDDFLFSLDIRVTIGEATATTTPRVHQLFQRTNQFNLTTRRYEATLLEARRYDPMWRIYTLRAHDRFSDPELVGAAMVSAAGPTWHIENLVLSCRVIGYGIESAMLAAITADARAVGALALTGEFVPSARNAPARDFFERHGFVAEGEEAETLWTFTLEHEMPAPAWIRIERIHGA